MRSLTTTTGLFCLLVLLGCRPAPTLYSLEQAIQQEFAAEQGVFALAFKDLATGEELLIDANDHFHAASTMKTPVMIELYKQAYEGVFSLSDSMLIKNEFHSIVDSSLYSMDIGEDSEEGLYSLIGTKKTIAELLYDMIIVSSNLATNILIEKVDAKRVTQTMRELGAPDIEVLRGVEDIKAFNLGLSNSTTAFDLLAIYEKLALGEVVNEAASEEMIDILFDQRFNEIIPAELPEEVRVAHKTGSITGVHHDSGIVFLPDGRKYVLVILSKELGSFDAGTERMAKVSRMVYDYVVSR